jgi:pimeloyl-ACP methyl ester carboxylesterase
MIEGCTKVRTADGVQIAYKVMGDGPCSLLLMHGWGGAGSGHSWAQIVKHISLSGLRLIAVDLRGHGQSARASGGFTVERFAQDILTVADHAGTRKFVAIGYSMSGRWVQWMSCHMPDRVAAQILIAPVPATVLPLSDEVIEQWIQDVQDRDRFERFIGQFTKDRLTPEILDAYFRDVSETSPLALRETLKMCRSGDFSSNLSATLAPTLVLAGSADPLLSPDFLREQVVARIPRARLVVLNCGHEIPVEQPWEAAALIEAFVAGLTDVEPV